MKYLYIILLCMLGITSCFPTHYFEPEIGDTSKVEGKISHKGDTCWFEVEYQHVMTKFQPGMAFKPFKYVVEIEGIESEEPKIITRKYPEFYEKWYEENGGYPDHSKAIIAFGTP